MYPAARYLEALIREFDEKFCGAKKEKKIIDFNDIEHYALEILEHEEGGGGIPGKIHPAFL